MLNFKIKAERMISRLFLQMGINDFDAACAYIANLPYRRNSNRSNLILVLEERVGTCSTKHALLRKLAIENGHPEVLLKMGVFKMHALYAPEIAPILTQYNLSYIPEAHNYLQYQNGYFDYTRIDADYSQFCDLLLDEITIEYHQIEDFKTAYHQSFLTNWAQALSIPYSVAELWKIRESCIAAMQSYS